MKRTERHHLKENELQLLTRHAREAIDARRREVTAALVAAAVIGVAALAYFAWRERSEARAHARLGQYDQAINAFKDLAQRKDGPLPIDGILMQLGRTYLTAGKPADAQQTFNRLVQEYPESPYSAEARKELDGLKKT